MLLEPYSKSWGEKFEKEAEHIRHILGDQALQIEHFGSTSIPGISAKPIIDMGVLVGSIDDGLDHYISLLEKNNYHYTPDMSSKKRIVFRKGDPVEFHLSLTSDAYQWWEKQMLFRNYLRKHQEFVVEYENLKKTNLENISVKDLEELCWNSEYTEKKTDFVEKVIGLARKEL